MLRETWSSLPDDRTIDLRFDLSSQSAIPENKRKRLSRPGAVPAMALRRSSQFLEQRYPVIGKSTTLRHPKLCFTTATFTHSSAVSMHQEGPSRVMSRSRLRHGGRVESDSDSVPDSDSGDRPWEHIVSTVRLRVGTIREKYFIPPSYEILIPSSADRMHRPPRGFCSFSLNHFDAGLRLPLAPYVSQILRRLELCPMQLSPNSIRHIIIFVILMRIYRYEPSFDNFWSLYSFTTSARSADNGFYYLSARKECRYLAPLTSNVGPWKKRFIFVHPPPGRGWPFSCEWVLEKPRPVVEGGGLEGDQIRSLSSYRYDPKTLLVEEVLKLAQLSPAPIPVEGSLDDMVGQSRLAQRIRSNRVRPSAGGTAPVPSSATSPHLGDSSAVPQGNQTRSPPIDIGSEDTRSHARPLNQPAPASPDRSHTGESDSGGLLPRRRRRGKSPMGPNTRSRSQSLALGHSASTALDDRRGMEMFNDISDCWRKAREDLRAPNHLMPPPVEERFIPNWNVSPNSTVLGSHSGQVSWELFNASCLPRDQAALIQSPFTRLEEHAAHSLIQASNLVRGLSLKCAGFRRNQLMAERSSGEMRLKVEEATARAENLEAQRAVLEARNKELEAHNKELEEKMAVEVSKATELGREAGFSAGQVAGKVEGRAEFLNSDEFSTRIREARLSGARDFIRAPSFDTALEIRAADYLVQGFDRCKAQVSTLKGFVPGFDLAQLDPSLDGDLRPFPEDPAASPKEDEFASLLDVIENM
ncbi:UNVERIFIED_CONTAM: hypothetical protein Sindi_0053200 [Sesamum indicum]